MPAIFGLSLLVLWEGVTRGADIPTVLLPPPSMIGERFAASTHILWADFKQTFLQAVLIGYALGCGSAFLVAVAIDRSPFLQRGLLPVGNLISALPIIGIAPIMVMWFGFDWPSKAAVVVVMTFFPTLVITVQGLQPAETMQRVHSYPKAARRVLFNPVGQIVGRMNEKRPSREVIFDLVSEYVDAVERVDSLVPEDVGV